MSENITDASQTPAEQPSGATLLGKMSEATQVLVEAQEKLVQAAADVARHTTDPNAHGAATLANIAKAMPTPVLENGLFTFKDADGNALIDPVNLKGEPGPQGNDGEKGDMPEHRWNGTALQLQNPDGSWGEERDLQGPKGADGLDGAPGATPGHEWNGTSLRFMNPDGTWGEEQNLQGPKGNDGTNGQDGAPGPMPDHQWDGTSLQIQKPDGSWSEPVNLQGETGPKGDPGDAAIATSEQPGVVQPDGVTTTVDEEGLLSALGGNLLANDDAWILESGSFVAPVEGWYAGTMWSGGWSGGIHLQRWRATPGASGVKKEFLVYLHKGQEIPVAVGAGGVATLFNGNIWAYTIGGSTSFGDIVADTTESVTDFSNRSYIFPGGTTIAGKATDSAGSYAPGGGRGAFWSDPGSSMKNATQAERNAFMHAMGHFGGGGSVYLYNDLYAVGNGAPGSIYLRWHNPAKAAGPLPEPALLSARRMAPRIAAAPATVNLYDPETGQGSVWREEDAEAKLAVGLITQEAWLEIRAAKAAEEYAEWLASPETEAERYDLLRAARDAKLAATDYLMAPDYPLSEEQQAEVTVYRQALRDLPAQAGAPWDGGAELTPWPGLPSILQPAEQADEPGQSENPED